MRLTIPLLLGFAILGVISCETSPKAVIKPFHTDGCSAFPDGTLADPEKWQAPCVEHDRAYWRGGSAEDRLQADRTLRQAVSAKGHPVIAEFMYLGVRLGGSPWWPTPWRWGFGWPYPRGYGSGTAGE